MKTCCNPEHKEPVPAAFVRDDTPQAAFFCEACAWMFDRYSDFTLRELAEWEEEQLSPEEKRQRDRDDYHDREYHRMKDEGLL